MEGYYFGQAAWNPKRPALPQPLLLVASDDTLVISLRHNCLTKLPMPSLARATSNTKFVRWLLLVLLTCFVPYRCPVSADLRLKGATSEQPGGSPCN